MALRLVEMVLTKDAEAQVDALLERLKALGHWDERLDNGKTLVRVLVESEDAESLIREIEARFSLDEGFRVMLLEVEATLPRQEEAKEPEEPVSPEPEEKQSASPERVAVVELVEKLVGGAYVSRPYVLALVLSTVVAAAGLIKGSVAVVIGAMVIAPLLTPNMALALATTLGDVRLAIRAAKTFAVGGVVSFALAALAGMVVRVDPTVGEISSRATVGMGDVVLALAAGSAGALAFTTGISAALVGVMVAVALLPPLVASGLLLGSGEFAMAWRALLLFATNVICVNLAGVFTFLFQGVRPRLWWDQDRAARMVRAAVVVWACLLVLLVGLIWWSTRG